MLTAEQWMSLVLLEVGSGLDSSDPVQARILDKVTPNISLIWAAWADKALVYPRLQYLYAKKQCLDILEGQLRDLVQTTIGGYNANQQGKLTNLQTLHKRVEDEIKILETQALTARPVVMTALTQTSSRMPDPTQPDPNKVSYRGDAIVRPIPNDPFGWQRGTI